ncbi:hypothetical protein DPMN_187146 [Dreissena polymorpha]|uniref:Uncharacterized protein n=1 Tax=Dreissena polymorpha TaxID=45954 RepID=A0A9D4DQE9_DREPO|nr:hypothetical protein DPMN_187146 [Dreissena polymorpha]
MNSKHICGHVFQRTGVIFVHIHAFIKTNILTQFHEDWTINWPLYTRKNDPPPDIIWTNLLTKFHDDRTINVAARELTMKNAPPPDGHVFQLTRTIFKTVQEIIRTNLLTKFHDYRTLYVASRVLTRFYFSHNMKNAPPLLGHDYLPTGTIFQHVQDIIETKFLTKLHDYREMNGPLDHIWKNVPPPGGHVFQPTSFIFELFQDFIGINILTKFHQDRKIKQEGLKGPKLLT